MTRASAFGDDLRKLLRYASIYGPGRTLFKVAGRLRTRLPRLSLRRSAADVGVIGCGQFAFATLAYFVVREFGYRFAACFDVDAGAAASFARALRVPRVCPSADALLALPGLRTVYIASNHASHAPYAVAALERDLDVYVEKPVAVTREQLVALLRAMDGRRARVFAGYNRPFARALSDLRAHLEIVPGEGITLQCFVAGHRIGADHWYRRSEEGTRVCGNVGHWLDLMVHVLCWRSLPDRLDISLSWADDAEPDDNLSITCVSELGDLLSVMLSSRGEPFEGVNETISFQHACTTCKIDDFRHLTLWKGAQLLRRRYWPKDVGHGRAILQPWGAGARDWKEVVASTLLMLHITDMVHKRQRLSSFSFIDGRAQLAAAVGLR